MARSCYKQGFVEIESEEHFLLRCRHPALKSHRENLLSKACTILPTFNTLSDTDKMAFLLSNCDIMFFSAKTCCKMLNIRTDVSRMGHVENSTIFHQKVADVPTSLGVNHGWY